MKKNQPINEHDEFQLNRLLDGDLPEDEAAELRRRIEQESGLQQALHALTRINDLLAERAGDRPTVNWNQFYQQVARAIAHENHSHRVIKISKWIGIAASLAAAAVVVLLVTVYQQPITEPSPRGNDSRVQDTKAQMVIEYHRPGSKTEPQEATVKVKYSQSTDLAHDTRQQDDAAEVGGSVGIGSGEPSPSIPVELLDDPAL